MTNKIRFTEGDFIEITPLETFGDSDDFGVIRGVALDTRRQYGLATFKVGVAIPGTTRHGLMHTLEFNLNHVEVKNLFRADYARRMDSEHENQVS